MNKLLILIIVLLTGVCVFLGGIVLSQSKKTTPPTPTQQSIAPVVPTIDQAKEAARSEAKISLTKDGFSPQIVTIKAGSRVVWTNNSGVDGTVNSDDHPTNAKYPPLNLGKFPTGFTLQLVFDTPGTYGYHNYLHPEQKGTVIVK